MRKMFATAPAVALLAGGLIGIGNADHNPHPMHVQTEQQQTKLVHSPRPPVPDSWKHQPAQQKAAAKAKVKHRIPHRLPGQHRVINHVKRF